MVKNEDQSKEKDVLGGLEDEFIGLVEFLNNQEDPTSENYATALKATIAVGNLWGDLNKIKLEERRTDLEYQDKQAQRDHERKIKEAEYQIKQLEVVDMSKMKGKDWAQICLDTGKTVLPLLTLVGITVLGWSNENHPIKPLITTSGTTRQATGILGRFIK